MRGETMTLAQEALKATIEKIDDIATIEHIRIFIKGMLAQQKIFERQNSATTPRTQGQVHTF